MATKENESESIDFQAWLDNNLDNSFGELEEGSIVKGTIVKIDKENEFNNQWGALLKAREEYYKNASKVLLKDL